MNVSGVGPGLPVQLPTREDMIAIAAARPAMLQQQAAALTAIGQGVSGDGTPKIDPSSGLDLFA